MKKDILVSCIIPTYKRSDMLLRAVMSALNQSYENIEVLVVDDNVPNDEYSLEVQKKLSSIHDKRLIYLSQKEHINGAVARNVGIKSANGLYVAFLDDDDEWDKNKIKNQLEYMAKNKNCKGCSCLYTFYKNNVPIKKCPFYNNDDLLFKILNRSVQMFTSTVLLEKKSLIDSGMFDEDLIRHQDLQMLADFVSKNNVVVLNEYLVNIYKDSDINRPKVLKTIEIKKIYLEKMDRHISTFSKKNQKRIFAAHNFEIVVQAIKEKKIKIALKYLFKIGFNILAYKDVFLRYYSKKKNSVR